MLTDMKASIAAIVVLVIFIVFTRTNLPQVSKEALSVYFWILLIVAGFIYARKEGII